MSLRGWGLFAAMSVAWGVPYLFIKIAVDDGLSPGFVAWSRVTLAAVLLLPLAWRAGALRDLKLRWVALFAATGVVLSAAYALWLYRKVIFGVLSKESLKGLLDLSTREKVVIYPLVVLVIFFGVYPAPILDATTASVQALVNNVTVSLDAVPQPQPAIVQPAAAAPAAAH